MTEHRPIYWDRKCDGYRGVVGIDEDGLYVTDVRESRPDTQRVGLVVKISFEYFRKHLRKWKG